MAIGIQRSTNRYSAAIGGSYGRAENKAEFADTMLNINQLAIDEITGIDVAKESANLLNSQSKLEHNTKAISNMLNAYSNFANQIFNNLKISQTKILS